MHEFIKRLLLHQLTYEERYWYAIRTPLKYIDKAEYSGYIPRIFDLLQNTSDPYFKRDAYLVLEEIIPEVVPVNWITFLVKEVESGRNRRKALGVLKKIKIPRSVDVEFLKRVVNEDKVNRTLALSTFKGVHDSETYLLDQLEKHKNERYEVCEIIKSVCEALTVVGSCSSLPALMMLKYDLQIKEASEYIDKSIKEIRNRCIKNNPN